MLSLFHPAVARWFQSQFPSPTEPQRLGWPAIQSGGHTLICAPTGSGKTLAAFLASLDELFREATERQLPDETRVLYVSPLKALSNDIQKNLQLPLQGIRSHLEPGYANLQIRAEVRTGDTPAAQRQSMRKKPPHLLVTTPESFYLLLTCESGRRNLRHVRTLIVDEIHALVNNRRGSHLSLSIERLAALVEQPLQRIGLSATQKPIEEVARFLVGSAAIDSHGNPPCHLINTGHRRPIDLALELPSSPLEAVLSNEVWEEVYQRLAQLIQEHRTTLIFVNTRRLTERVSHQLSQRLGDHAVASHHGSLSAKLRLDAEDRLKKGHLKALVATSSLELGIDIGAIDLVCQLGSTRRISALLQRVGRAEHRLGGLPKGRLFPLSRDDLVECAVLLQCVRTGELDHLEIPDKPLDILAQQIVAGAACEVWQEDDLFHLAKRAYPYRNLTREEFDAIIAMLAHGFSTRRGRKGALLHYDAVHKRIRARRGARLIALTCGGAIPETGDYRVILEPAETFIGTLNEDFAIESLAGDIFQLGSSSWKIVRVHSGTVRVEDAQGQPPNMPFWLGEAPARSAELSAAVSNFRSALEKQLDDPSAALGWIRQQTDISTQAAAQILDYYQAGKRTLGVIPTQQQLVIERFFDETGGMQLVLHSPYGSRINRAWGLALRKRFCRKFNFELQAAATDDALVLSLGAQHSFPLEEVFRYLNSTSARQLLIQALLEAPMFTIRWRWNAARALAVLRQKGGRKNPPPLQRMEAEDLIAAVFPDQLACAENIVGDREVPDHPLVNQTIEDCLTEAMDLGGLLQLLKNIEQKQIVCWAKDLPEPSLFAHEILNAKPYAFLDDAPLEERRTRAVYTRRTLEPSSSSELGQLDLAAIQAVCQEAWPPMETADELHDLLLLVGLLAEEELRSMPAGFPLMNHLQQDRRAARFFLQPKAGAFWAAAERFALLKAIYPEGEAHPDLVVPERERARAWERTEALRELLRGRLEVSGPIAASDLERKFCLSSSDVQTALIALESEGFILRGRFHPQAQELQWCDRRLLARIHRLTIHKLRQEIQPVAIAEFLRFLAAWQRLSTEYRAQGAEGVGAVLDLLDGYELPAAAWEPYVLASRVENYDPQWLDRFCLTGRTGWGRLSSPQTANYRGFTAIRSSPISLFQRDHIQDWLSLGSGTLPTQALAPEANQVLHILQTQGALFFAELVRRSGLLATKLEEVLGELVAAGCVSSDTFDGVRAFLVPSNKRPTLLANHGPKNKTIASVELAGRWFLLRSAETPASPAAEPKSQRAIETYARVLLRRYGIVFRRLLERECFSISWFELGRVYRRLEARGEIRGGHFVSGISGEHFALPDGVGLLRALRKSGPRGELTTISAADPLNLVAILTPGERIPAIASHRILLRDGVPIAALVAKRVIPLQPDLTEPERVIQAALKIGKLAPALRPYY